MVEALSLWGSVGRHIQSLLELAGLEGREALALYVRLAVMLVAALIFLVFGYVLALLFFAFLIAHLFGISWIWITLGLAVLHLLVTFLCASHVRTHMRSPVFTATSAELRKDFEALKTSKP
jgi:uncharacterized membrane protein YqjE